jgi:alpha-glucosidase
LYGDATLATASDGSLLLSADGPVFAAWALPGVVVP